MVFCFKETGRAGAGGGGGIVGGSRDGGPGDNRVPPHVRLGPGGGKPGMGNHDLGGGGGIVGCNGGLYLNGLGGYIGGGTGSGGIGGIGRKPGGGPPKPK